MKTNKSQTFLIFLCFFLFLAPKLFAQINGYASVSGVSPANSRITIPDGDSDETYDTFVVGEQAIILQIQDNILGSNADNNSFGDASTNMRSVGYYEVITITNIQYYSPSGNIHRIYYSGTLQNAYHTNSNSSVQVITYPVLGSGNYTTTTDITTLDWNGLYGGVIAFQVNGTLTLANNIIADGTGFRGASANGGGNTDCTSGTYRTASGDNHADKGEGIYKIDIISNPEYVAARGKILNGGGGGNSHNAGGGGGGNFSAGGDGGPGWSGSSPGYCSPTSGGIGGISLLAYISGDRVFMGGGGGSGEGNDNGATPGGNGGGIILIKANKLVTSGNCGSLSISANGEDAFDAGSLGGGANDGAGGAGAGGSIVLDIPSFQVVSGCTLTVSASGGNGGSVNYPDTHGGGGGGGMGAVIYSIPQPNTNINTITDPGSGGSNNSSGGGPVPNPGTGTPGDGEGIVENEIIPLPVVFKSFSSELFQNNIVLQWITASEQNNDYFEVHRSVDGIQFEVIGKVEGNGTTNEPQEYGFVDEHPHFGINYYRLRQVDYNGDFMYSDLIYQMGEIGSGIQEFSTFPNPTVNKQCSVVIPHPPAGKITITIYNQLGFAVFSDQLRANENESVIHQDYHLDKLVSGVYIIEVKTKNYKQQKKIIIQ